MVDFTEFDKRYPTEMDCLTYLEKLRWPDGYRCPRCDCRKMSILNGKEFDKDTNSNNINTLIKYKCSCCNYQTSFTAGTLFHHTHLSIRQWFMAIWYMSIQKDKATASELQKIVGIGSNRTALSVFNKIKSVMFTTDETFINRKLKGTVEICINDRKNLMTAVEVNNAQKGHVRLYHMPKYNTEYFHRFVLKYVKVGSAIKREDKLGDITHDLEGAVYKIIRPQYFPAPNARMVYKNFGEYYKRERMANENIKLNEIMKKYMELVNSFTYDLSFDDILHNAVTGELRKSPLKR